MRVIVGVDGSPQSAHALSWACRRGETCGDTVRAVCAWSLGASGEDWTPPPGVKPEGQRHAEQVLREAVEREYLILFEHVPVIAAGGLYLAGLIVSELRNLQVTSLTPQMQKFFAVLSYVLPNFGNYDVLGAAAHGRSVAGTLVLHNTLYTLLYCAMVLGAAAVIFSRKDLK